MLQFKKKNNMRHLRLQNDVINGKWDLLNDCSSIDLIDNRIKWDYYVTSSGEDDGIYVR